MPINYARRLTGRQRAAQSNRHLGVALAFVAGATNAGGFLAVKQYTSHMTGIVSAAADNLVLGAFAAAVDCAGALLAFLAGAACCALMVNFARRRGLHSEFALPLMLEALLLLVFGVLGARLQQIDVLVIPATVTLLCFMMGLQNAVITKLSHAEIRTTHVTGILTDLGIEAGKALYWNRDAHGVPAVTCDRARVRVLLSLVLAFFVGGIVGGSRLHRHLAAGGDPGRHGHRPHHRRRARAGPARLDILAAVDQHRNGAVGQYFLRFAAEHQAGQAAASARGHGDQVAAVLQGGGHDGRVRPLGAHLQCTARHAQRLGLGGDGLQDGVGGRRGARFAQDVLLGQHVDGGDAGTGVAREAQRGCGCHVGGGRTVAGN
jgi:uncharacterized membrane protein YoaK (UPF0700 family)